MPFQQTPRNSVPDTGWNPTYLAGLRGPDSSVLRSIFTSLKDYLRRLVLLAPTGSVTMFCNAITQTVSAGVVTTTAPDGWLLCNGNAISRSIYRPLFNLIGTTYGAGDGSTTFNLPDLRGRAPIGVGQGTGLTNRALAGTGGAETHTLSAAEMPSHDHDIHRSGTFTALSGTAVAPNIQANSGTSIGRTNSAGSGGAHNNMQPWIALNFIIKT